MRARRFIALSVIFLIVLLTAYLIVVDKKLSVDREVPKSYKQFMLESAVDYPGDKILIVGGSDAHHGINPLMMEQAFNMPVLNIADNGAYPLTHKMYNLLRYVNKGDIVILSLAWHYYLIDHTITGDYINAITDINGVFSFYYENLPVYDKIRFVFREFPLKKISSLFTSSVDNKAFVAHQYDAGDEISRKIGSNFRDTRGGDLHNVRETSTQGENMTCDSYIFFAPFHNILADALPGDYYKTRISMGGVDNFLEDVYFTRLRRLENQGTVISVKMTEVSSQFEKVFKLVDEVHEKGARVLFTWPVVTDYKDDDECYGSRQATGINELADNIQWQVETHGYQMIGDYMDSRFSSDCFYNTYAHVRADCADIRTKRLIQSLADAGINTASGDYRRNRFDDHLQEHLEGRIERLDQRVVNPRSEIIDTIPAVGVTGSNLRRRLIMRAGWSVQENWGVWSNGYHSSLFVRLKSGSKRDRLKIRGDYYHGVEKTGVSINGVKIGNYVLKDAEIDIPAGLIGSDLVTIRFDHESPVSPAALDPAFKDTRLLKFGLKYINIL